jgi:hypothetical protein
VGLVAAIAAVVGLGALFNLTGTNVALAAGERELVVDISHLKGWMEGYTPDPSGETLQKTRYIDDSFEIEYVYDLPQDDAAPYLSYSVTFEPSESDANTTYVSLWGGTKVAFYVFGEVQVSAGKNELFRWGDESRFGLLRTVDPSETSSWRRRESGWCTCWSRGFISTTPRVLGLLTPYLEKLDAFPVEVNGYGRARSVDRLDHVEEVVLDLAELEARAGHVLDGGPVQVRPTGAIAASSRRARLNGK